MLQLDSETKATTKDIRILNFLNEHRTGVLATADGADTPHGSVIYYRTDNNFDVTFLTKTRTRKSENIRNNPHALLVVYDERSQTTVQIKGVVTELTDSREVSRVFRDTLRASLQLSNGAVPPISKLNAGRHIAYKLTPSEICMAVYARPHSGGYETVFEVMEFPERL